jgi:hypothetical protein
VWLLPFQATAFARICCPDPHEKRTNRELLITDFNQIEIEKAMTGERLKLIILLMQDLNLSFVVKVGAIPQPILATIVLMTELNKADNQRLKVSSHWSMSTSRIWLDRVPSPARQAASSGVVEANRA